MGKWVWANLENHVVYIICNMILCIIARVLLDTIFEYNNTKYDVLLYYYNASI